MFATQTTQPTTTRTVVLYLVAVTLGLLVAEFAAANEYARSPRLLSTRLTAAAEPLIAITQEFGSEEPSEALLDILAAQSEERWEDAYDGWLEIPLPAESEVWRRVGLGVCSLHLGDLTAAGSELSVALKLDPQNATAYYFLGQLRWEQASLAAEWFDAYRPGHVRAVTYQEVAGLTPLRTRGHYIMDAIAALDHAIELYTDSNCDAGLIVIDTDGAATVEDFVRSLGVPHLAGCSHALLAEIYLEQHAPDRAEYHIGQGLELGVEVTAGYREVAELYSQMDRGRDAARAHLKSIRQEASTLGPILKAVDALQGTW